MDNNDIYRRLRYIFDLDDWKMIEIFDSAEAAVSRSEVSNWLKKEDDPGFSSMSDKALAFFLNGFINEKRGKKEGVVAKVENRLNNNLILRKLKIALHLIDEDILEILKLGGKELSKHELSAFFRHPKQHQYRPCKDQVLRNFVQGLQLKYRGDGYK